MSPHEWYKDGPVWKCGRCRCIVANSSFYESGPPVDLRAWFYDNETDEEKTMSCDERVAFNVLRS